MAYLNERDPFRRAMMQRLANRHMELVTELHDDLAYRIIDRLGKSFKTK